MLHAAYCLVWAKCAVHHSYSTVGSCRCGGRDKVLQHTYQTKMSAPQSKTYTPLLSSREGFNRPSGISTAYEREDRWEQKMLSTHSRTYLNAPVSLESYRQEGATGRNVHAL